MEYKIISEKRKITVRFFEKRGKKGKINKSVICHLKDVLSLWYGKLEVSEHSNNNCLEYIDLILTVPKRKIKNEREILNSAKTFLKDFFLAHAINVCSCDKCEQKSRPTFCSRNSHNIAVA